MDDQTLSQDPAPAVESGENWLTNAPWWLVSGGVHVVILLAATLVYVNRLMAIEQTGMTIAVAPRPAGVIPDLPEKRDVFVRRGLPTDDANTPDANDDPIIFFPEAKDADHNESADGEDHRQMKGQSKDFLTYLPGEAGGFRCRQIGTVPGVYDTMGPGGGAGSGGRHGGPFGGRENLRKKGSSATPITESAVIAALKWLARHQSEDGAWRATAYTDRCVGARCSGGGDEDFDAGLTALSLLAFLGAGHTHLSREEHPDPMIPGRMLKFGEVVKKATMWLIAQQDPNDGCIGSRGPQHMYNHTIAALALSEAYGMAPVTVLREPAQKAVNFLVAAQNPGKGWRYQSRPGDNDTSVTGWAIMALKSAELSELEAPRSAYDGALAWLDEATGRDGYYTVGYTGPGPQVVVERGKNEQFAQHPSMSAVAIMSRIFIQKKRVPQLGSVALLLADLPEWKQNMVDFYYWYYGSLALFQYDGPDGPTWKKWNEPMKNAIVPNQKTSKDACQNGSWNPAEDRWGHRGGRVYAVAINALTLEVYYRYANVFGTRK